MMYASLCTEFYDADKQFASPAEINFYKKILNPTDLILEPMCGSGRLLIPLLQAGYNIEGCDNSIAMLESCKERARKLELQPNLYQFPIETMILPHHYDAIIIPLGSFQLLYPRKIAFQTLINLKKHLKINGRLIIDLFIPWEMLSENSKEEFSERQIKTAEGAIINGQFHSAANRFKQYIQCQNKYTKLVHDKIVANESEDMMISWYYLYEIELILEKYGFKNIKIHERFLNNENYITFVCEA